MSAWRNSFLWCIALWILTNVTGHDSTATVHTEQMFLYPECSPALSCRDKLDCHPSDWQLLFCLPPYNSVLSRITYESNNTMYSLLNSLFFCSKICWFHLKLCKSIVYSLLLNRIPFLQMHHCLLIRLPNIRLW